MTRANKLFAAAVLVGAFASFTSAQTSSAPASTPAADTPEQAAVRKVATTFFTNLAEGKTDDALKDFAGDEKDKHLAELVGGFTAKFQALKKAAETKFGAEAVKAIPGNDFDVKQQVDRVNRGPVAINGDTATVAAIGDKGGVTLKKVESAWKVTSITGDADATEMGESLISIVGSVMDRGTKDITAGKYATIEDAKKAMETQVKTAVLMSAMAKDRHSTTAPSTQPAPSPGGKPVPQPLPQQPAD